MRAISIVSMPQRIGASPATAGAGGAWEGHVAQAPGANRDAEDFYQAGLNLSFGAFAIGGAFEYYHDFLDQDGDDRVDPRRAGQFAIAVEGEPGGEDGVERLLPAGEDRRDPGPNRPAADDQFPLAADQGDVPDFDAGHIGDRVERPGRAVERDAQVAGARLPRGGHGYQRVVTFFDWVQNSMELLPVMSPTPLRSSSGTLPRSSTVR